jgi:hypothetical protein
VSFGAGASAECVSSPLAILLLSVMLFIFIRKLMLALTHSCLNSWSWSEREAEHKEEGSRALIPVVLQSFLFIGHVINSLSLCFLQFLNIIA